MSNLLTSFKGPYFVVGCDPAGMKGPSNGGGSVQHPKKSIKVPPLSLWLTEPSADTDWSKSPPIYDEETKKHLQQSFWKTSGKSNAARGRRSSEMKAAAFATRMQTWTKFAELHGHPRVPKVRNNQSNLFVTRYWHQLELFLSNKKLAYETDPDSIPLIQKKLMLEIDPQFFGDNMIVSTIILFSIVYLFLHYLLYISHTFCFTWIIL